MLHQSIQLTFTISDIITGICYFVGIFASVYLGLVLREIFAFVKKINTLYDENTECINALLKDSSKIITKTANLTDSIPDEPFAFMNNIKSSMPFLGTIISALFNKKSK